MGRRINLKMHDCKEDIEAAFRTEPDGVRKGNLQAVMMVSKGRPTIDVRENTTYSASWIYVQCRRYSEGGLENVYDRRKNNGGHRRLLNDELQEELRVLLSGPPPDGGLWTSPKVAAWMGEKLGREVNFKVAWAIMKRMGYSLKVPRPSHAAANSEDREQFKKKDCKTQSKKSSSSTPARRFKSGAKTKVESA